MIRQLKQELAQILTGWAVTINEADMLNVEADNLDGGALFAYIEEFGSTRVEFSFGRKETRTIEIYFCKILPEIDTRAEDRERIRVEEILPAVRQAEKFIHDSYGVTSFNHDTYPRGFDVNEVLIHVTFEAGLRVC